MANGKNFEIAFALNSKLDSSFNKAFSGAGKQMAGLVKAAKAAAVAVGSSAIISNIVNTSAEFEQAMSDMQAQSGATKEEMESMRKSAKNLFGSNYGENIDAITDAMSNVAQQTKLSGQELEVFTKNALVMQDTFDFATEESTRAVNQMRKSLGTSSTEAFNLLAQGAQNGLNANGDLMDMINEYSVHFGQMGFTAEEMFNMIGNGADSGVFQVEKLGDAIKEFGIRSKDGSNGTLEAFKNLGLNNTKVTKSFAEGGETAKKAFEQVTAALFAMDDKVLQDQTGVALFGTMWEDLGKDGIKALSNLNGEFDRTTQTIDGINDIKYDNLKSVWGGFLRQMDLVKIGIVEKVTPSLKSIIRFGTESIPRALEAAGKAFNTLKIWGSETFEKIKTKIAENQPLLDKLKIVVDEIKLFFNDMGIKGQDAFAAMQPTLIWIKDNGLPFVANGIMIIIEKATDMYNFIKDNWDSIEPIVLGIAAALGTYKLGVLGAKAATTIYTGITKGLTLAQGALNTVMNLSPLAKVALLIGIAVAAGIYLYKNWDKIKAKATELWEKIKSVFGNIGPWFKEKWDSVLQITTNVWGSIKDFLSTFPLGQAFLQNITNMVDSIKTIFDGVTTFISGVFSGNWQMAWDGIKQIFEGVFSGLVGIVKWPINAIIGLVNQAISGVNSLSIEIPDWVPEWAGGGKTLGFNIPQIPLFAKGTNSTPRGAFIAGEKGPELITGAPGRRVFTNAQTNDVFSKSNSAPQLTFNPVINITGGDANIMATIQQVLASEKKKLFAEFKALIKNDRRLNYATE